MQPAQAHAWVKPFISVYVFEDDAHSYDLVLSCLFLHPCLRPAPSSPSTSPQLPSNPHPYLQAELSAARAEAGAQASRADEHAARLDSERRLRMQLQASGGWGGVHRMKLMKRPFSNTCS